ncbi:MAG: hypothetical protein J6Y78_09315 [Paludibacteraceae bacterium]|nr:hypothetical protein [Paludibacteraceae bacterium]
MLEYMLTLVDVMRKESENLSEVKIEKNYCAGIDVVYQKDGSNEWFWLFNPNTGKEGKHHKLNF